jgi:hypothetical protein
MFSILRLSGVMFRSGCGVVGVLRRVDCDADCGLVCVIVFLGFALAWWAFRCGLRWCVLLWFWLW